MRYQRLKIALPRRRLLRFEVARLPSSQRPWWSRCCPWCWPRIVTSWWRPLECFIGQLRPTTASIGWQRSCTPRTTAACTSNTRPSWPRPYRTRIGPGGPTFGCIGLRSLHVSWGCWWRSIGMSFLKVQSSAIRELSRKKNGEKVVGKVLGPLGPLKNWSPT